MNSINKDAAVEAEKLLIVAYRENDTQAQSELINRYKPLVRQIVYGVIKSHAKGLDANDMIQEGLIALNDAIMNYDLNSDYPLYALVRVCVSRRITSYLRYVHKGYNMWNTLSIDYHLNEDGDTSLLDTICDSRQTTNSYIYLLEGLNEDEKRLFDEKVQGYTYSELAVKHNSSTRQIDYQMRKMMNKIRYLKELEAAENEKAALNKEDETVKKILELRKKRMTYKNISREMNMEEKEIRAIVKKMKK